MKMPSAIKILNLHGLCGHWSEGNLKLLFWITIPLWDLSLDCMVVGNNIPVHLDSPVIPLLLVHDYYCSNIHDDNAVRIGTIKRCLYWTQLFFGKCLKDITTYSSFHNRTLKWPLYTHCCYYSCDMFSLTVEL